MEGALIYRLVIDLMLAAGLAAMPVMRGEEAFFGVRVGRDFYEGRGRRILRTYRFGLAVTLAIYEGLMLGLSRFLNEEPMSQTVLMLLMIVTGTALYIYSYRRVRPFEVRGERQRFAISLKPRGVDGHRNVYFYSALIMILAAPFILIPIFYPSMPDVIPVHWNMRGEVDGWARKSVSAVLVLPALSVYLQGLFLLLKRGMLGVKMTLPAERSEEYLHYKEESLRVAVALVEWLSLLCALLLTTLAAIMIMAGSEYQQFIQTYMVKVVLVIGSLMMLCLAYYLYRIWEVNKKMKEATGRVYVQRETDAAGWYGGGLIYYNPEDPAVFVEKMVGLGYTINLGNKRALVYLFYILGLFAFTAWALLSL